MNIVTAADGRVTGLYSWTTGFKPLLIKSGTRKPTFREEAQRDPEGFIQKLMDQYRWDEAEWVMDTYLQ